MVFKPLKISEQSNFISSKQVEVNELVRCCSFDSIKMVYSVAERVEIQNKIRLWEAQMLSGNSYRFTTLSACENMAYAHYAEELKVLSEQLSNRVSDFRNMENCFNILCSVLKSKFEDVEMCDFYKKYFEEDHFPQLRKFAKRLICAFGDS